jgi:hypothetical protein
MGSNQKFIYYHCDGSFIKDIKEYEVDNSPCHFPNKNVMVMKFGVFLFLIWLVIINFYINDGSLIPGWRNKTSFLQGWK